MAQPLKVTCPSCMAKFHIPLHLVRGKVVSFRCKKCKGAIPVDGRALTSATPQPLPAPSVAPPNASDPRAPFYSEPPMRLSLSDGIVVHERLPSTAGLQADTPAAFTQSSPPPLPRPVVPGASRTPSYGVTPALLASAPPPAVSRSDPPDALRRSEPPPSFRSSGRGKKIAGGLMFLAAAGLTLWGVGTRVRTRAARTAQAADHAKLAPPPNPIRAATPEPARPSAPALAATEATPSIPVAALPAAKDIEPGSPKSTAAARARARALKAAAAAAAEAPAETAQAPEETSGTVTAAQPLTGPAVAAQEATTTVSQDIDFNKEAARQALEEAGQRASSCRTIDTPPGAARVAVTFAPSGTVTSAIIDSGPFVGTAAGGCVASKFRTVHVPAFTGDPVTVHKSIPF